MKKRLDAFGYYAYDDFPHDSWLIIEAHLTYSIWNVRTALIEIKCDSSLPILYVFSEWRIFESSLPCQTWEVLQRTQP